MEWYQWTAVGVGVWLAGMAPFYVAATSGYAPGDDTSLRPQDWLFILLWPLAFPLALLRGG